MIESSKHWLLTGILAFGLVGAACTQNGPDVQTGDSSGGSGDAGVEAGSTDDTDSPDLGLGAVTVSLDPAIHVYRSAVRVKTEATVVDSDGNELPDADVSWKVEPEGAAEKTGQRWKFTAEGDVTFVACANHEKWDRDVCGRKTVVVDEGPPKIEIDSPESGAQLGTNGSDKVTVSGKIVDAREDVQAFVNGESVELDDNGKFSTTIAPDFGVNHVEVTASDGVSNSDGTAVREFLWAGEWEPINSDSGEVSYGFDDGIALDLGQNFFDDGKPAVHNKMESKLVTNDFADLIELAIRTIDLSQKIPPQFDTGNGVVKLVDVSLSSPAVEIDVTDQGIDVYLTIGGLDITTGGKIKVDRENLNLSGNITGRAIAVARLSLTKPGPDKEFQADLDKIDISIDDLESHFASDQANAIFDLAESALRSKLEDIVVKTVRQEFVNTLPQMLTETLNSLEDRLASQSFEFDSEFTGKREMKFKGAIDKFETKYRDSMLSVLSTHVTATGMDLFSMAPGIPMMTPTAQDLPLFQESRIQIGLRLGVLNGLMATLWRAGFLEIDATDVIPGNIENLIKQAEVSGRMPPVMRPANRSEPYDLVLEAGQLEMTAEMLEQTDVFGLKVTTGINITIEDNTLSLEIPDKPKLEAWLIETDADDGSPVLGPDKLRAIIVSNLWPKLEETLKNGLELELPVPEISGLTDLSTRLNDLDLSFELVRPIDIRRGYIIFDTALKGELPYGGSP